MFKISVEYLLLFVVIICLVYYSMGSCGCGFSVGGPTCELQDDGMSGWYDDSGQTRWPSSNGCACPDGTVHTQHTKLENVWHCAPPLLTPDGIPVCQPGWYDDSGRQGPGRSRWPPSNGCVCPDGRVPRQHEVLPYTWHCAPPPPTPTPPMCEPQWYDDSGLSEWPSSNGCECRDGTVLTQHPNHSSFPNTWRCALPPLIPGPTLGNCECIERLRNGYCVDSSTTPPSGVWYTECTDQKNEESCKTDDLDFCRWIPKCDCSKSISQDWCADSIEHQPNQPRILCTNQTTEGSCGTAGAGAGIGINTCKWRNDRY